MYKVCRLVHADLSEYNILYHAKVCYIIDVSQSVEHDHPHALEFLRKDCENINDYFGKKQVQVLSLKALFEFIVSEIKEGEEEEALERLSLEKYDPVSERVFSQVYIPQKLDELPNNKSEITHQMEAFLKTESLSDSDQSESDQDDDKRQQKDSKIWKTDKEANKVY